MPADDFRRGAGHALAGFGLLGKPRLRAFVVVPLTINLLVFVLAIAWLAGSVGHLIDGATQLLPSWLDWLRWLLWPLFVGSVALVGFYTFTLVANFIGAPFNGILAERVEDMLDPETSRPASRPLLAELVRAPLAELLKLARFVLVAIPLLALFLVPVLNVLAPPLWFAFSAWTLALQYADYPLGNHGMGFGAQRRLLRERHMLTLGFGATVLALTLVPVVNFLVMPAAVAGATRLWVTDLKPRRSAASQPD